MLIQLSASCVPQSLRTVALTDRNHLPRYWATIWLAVAGAHWARSTQITRLRYLDGLYEHAGRLFGANALDEALSTVDESKLADILESWFMSLRNQTVATRSMRIDGRPGLALSGRQSHGCRSLVTHQCVR